MSVYVIIRPIRGSLRELNLRENKSFGIDVPTLSPSLSNETIQRERECVELASQLALLIISSDTAKSPVSYGRFALHHYRLEIALKIPIFYYRSLLYLLTYVSIYLSINHSIGGSTYLYLRRYATFHGDVTIT